MFGFIKNLFNRSDAANTAAPVTAPTSSQPTSSTNGRVTATSALPPTPVLNHRRAADGTNGHGDVKSIELALALVLKGLPLELQSRVRSTNVDGITIAIPLDKILAQLASGSVKIPFGELRQAAPQAFSKENNGDRIMVPLPLGDVLSQIQPLLVQLRRTQKQVEVPEEISSPFDARGQGLVFSVSPAKAAAPTPAPAPAPTPTLAPAARGSLNSVPPPQPPAVALPPAPTMITAARALQEMSAPTTPAPIVSKAPTAPVKPAAPAASPLIPLSSITPIPFKPITSAASAPAPAPAAPKPAPAPAPTPAPAAPLPSLTMAAQASTPTATPAAPELPPFMLALSTLADNWPDVIRKEIVQLNLAEAKVALPHEAAAQALKQGRIAFSWKTVRGWISGAPGTFTSNADATVVELPLKAVAPIFLARQAEQARGKQKVAVDENIPNLFFGFPQPNTPSGDTTAPAITPAPVKTADVVKPADTNYYVWDDNGDTARVEESQVKRGPTPGTKFVAKYATPNEIVSRASSLDGVAGALIALPDGLMVASRLSGDMNADTLAAFLPQIFGKVSQCTKELRMGELNNLNFTVGNIPWKIFRVNAIFFAAFGRAGAPLPTGQLAALAAELDHKPKQ